MLKQQSLRAVALRDLVVLCALMAVAIVGTTAVSSWAQPDHNHDHGDHSHDHGDHHHGHDDMSPEHNADMMKNWEESMKLNEHHQRLRMFVGDWDVVTKHWMEPGSEPNVSKAESECEMVFNGRYVRQTYEGVIEMPDASGKMTKQKFRGESMMGYDNVKRQYVSTWIDSMSTGIWMEHGQWDANENAFVMYSDFIDPMTRQPSRAKSIHRFMGKNKMVSEMHKQAGPGQWYKELEITYKRD